LAAFFYCITARFCLSLPKLIDYDIS
jgi:hypothetical protein